MRSASEAAGEEDGCIEYGDRDRSETGVVIALAFGFGIGIGS